VKAGSAEKPGHKIQGQNEKGTPGRGRESLGEGERIYRAETKANGGGRDFALGDLK